VTPQQAEVLTTPMPEIVGIPSKEVIIGGYQFTLHGLSSDDLYFTQIGHGFDSEFDALFRYLILPDYVSLDVGANIGTKSLLLSRHCPAGSVVAIEAAPTVLRCLEANIAVNAANNVVIERTAVGDREGMVCFTENSAWGHVVSDGPQVPITTLDEIVTRHNLSRVDFIKLDTEGYELTILKRSLDLVNRFHSLVAVEMNAFAQLAFANVSPREFVDWITMNFSHVFALRRDGTAGGEVLERIEKRDAIALLHRNLVGDKCVTDLVVTNAERRLVPSATHLQAQNSANLSRLTALIVQRDTAVTERDAASAQRETAVAERDAALVEQDAVSVQRDHAVAERDAALVEREAANAQRDRAIIERDAASAQRDVALVERDAELVERDAANAQRDRAVAERDAALVERDAASAQRDRAIAERDAELVERDAANAQRDRAVVERDQRKAEADALYNSTSWKLTRPLRWARTTVARSGGNLARQES
jgi:FkbM family methyltransferase